MIRMIINTGAAVNMMDEESYHKLKNKPDFTSITTHIGLLGMPEWRRE